MIVVDIRPAMADAPVRILFGIVLWIVALQRRQRERLQLACMDDATLRDIGLSRSDVLAELRKPVWRR